MSIIIYIVAYAVVQTWMLCGVLIRICQIGPVVNTRIKDVIRLCSRVKGELQPFYWPCVAVIILDHIITDPDRNWYDPLLHGLSLGIYVLIWHLYKNVGDDNDKWKKRKRKAIEKIVATAGGLKVVPSAA